MTHDEALEILEDNWTSISNPRESVERLNQVLDIVVARLKQKCVYCKYFIPNLPQGGTACSVMLDDGNPVLVEMDFYCGDFEERKGDDRGWHN